MHGLFARPPVQSTARYWIVIDRPGEMDYDEGFYEGGHNGNAQAAVEQVARELQEAIDMTGNPTCFFRVVAREIIDERDKPLDALATRYEDGKVSG